MEKQDLVENSFTMLHCSEFSASLCPPGMDIGMVHPSSVHKLQGGRVRRRGFLRRESKADGAL